MRGLILWRCHQWLMWCRFEMKIENVPSVENPRTGKLTPLSVIAALRGIAAPMRIGT